MPVTLRRLFMWMSLVFTGLLTVFARAAYACQGKPANEIEKAIIEKSFSFIAQSATPLRGTTRILTPEYYYLQIRKDSLISFLPYYGNRYSTPSSTELIYGGYQFAEPMLTYTVIRRRNHQEIRITAKPYNDKLIISISITGNGWAEVYIQSSGQDPISYYGRLTIL